ncbi:hypothetical protein NDN08_004213 [Rhodosorus marinus]|uniref:Methyltransferase domain-containing protein n=1 Tax=Rhodosorus marinus TaxID=101924 RepID=A0AAV8UL50_9RHOD|nr:hypothetical protein NDN08_004213 [Rhodosorus marinus]
MLEELWRAIANLRDEARSSVYNFCIVSFTAKWYSAVLNRLPEGAHILDVGIGTGTALMRNANQILEKKIRVTGVDYDESYVLKCKKEIAEKHLEHWVSVVHDSIYDFRPKSSEGAKIFDAVYFSGSFMILPDKPAALKRVITFLKDGHRGRIFFTQTFEEKQNPFLEWLKPRLSYWTSIDFGSVTYEEEFDEVLESCGVFIAQKTSINDGKKVAGVRRSVMVEGRPRKL